MNGKSSLNIARQKFISKQARYWILTVPRNSFEPHRPDGVSFIAGQLELGESESDYEHWQLVVYFKDKVSLLRVRECFGPWHAEPTRSKAARQYVWKDRTAIPNTRFEIGEESLNRNDPTDWERVWKSAASGILQDIPADIRVRSYQALRTIARDNLQATPMKRECFVYWGKTGTGKSKKAWDQAGWKAYPKDPNTKFWDGFQGQDHVVIDEFRGMISISHMLRWLDRYPVIVEIKGSAIALTATKIWITSNLNPRMWYPDADAATVEALLRRLQIKEFVFENIFNVDDYLAYDTE